MAPKLLHIPEVKARDEPCRPGVLDWVLRFARERGCLFYYDGQLFVIRRTGILPTHVDNRRK